MRILIATLLLASAGAFGQIQTINPNDPVKGSQVVINANFSYLNTQLGLKQPALGFTPVPNTRTVNGLPLSSNIVIDTSLVGENGNLYFTTARARAAVSGSGMISYDAATGVFSCPLCGTGSSSGDGTWGSGPGSVSTWGGN